MNEPSSAPPMSGRSPELGAEPLACPAIPGFEIIRLIGAGGMGAVYEAWQDQPHRKVALKLIRPGLLSPEHLRRFEQEINLLGRLEHPVIARIYSTGTVEASGVWQPYFVMEYIEGQSLADYLRVHSPATRDRIKLILHIAEGVHYAHQRGVIHCDLKPANIVLNAEGQPRILDFGVARNLGTPAASGSVFSSGVGTPAYMAPEQWASPRGQADIRSDVYALGIILFETLAGRSPYPSLPRPGEDALQVLRNQTPQRLQEADKIWRGDLDFIVAKALAINKEDRYDSAVAFANDLKRFLENRPVEAHPSSSWYQLRKFTRRHRNLVLSGLLIVSALAVGLSIASFALAKALRAEREAKRQRDRAELNLQGAMDAVDQFMTTVSRSSLAKIPEAREIRLALLSDAAAFYENYALANQDHPQLQDSAQRALLRLTYIREQKDHSPLESVEFIKERIAHLSNRQEAAPANADLKFELAWAWNDLADAHHAAGNVEGQRSARLTALDIERALVQQEPTNIGYRRDLARNIEKWARELGEQGDYAASMAAYEDAQAVYEALIADYPSVTIYDRELARCLEEMGKTKARAGSVGEGVALLHQAGVRFRELAEANTDDPSYLRDLSQNLVEQGKALLSAHQYQEAAGSFEAANQADQELNVRFPGNFEYQRSRARNLGNLGRALFYQSDFTTAGHRYHEAEAIYQELLQRQPNDRRAKLEYAYLLGDWARVLTGPTALAKLEQARTVWKDFIKLEPFNDSHAKSLAWVEKELVRQKTASRPEEPRSGVPSTPSVAASNHYIAASDYATLTDHAGRTERVRGRVLAVFQVPGKAGITLIKFGRTRNDFCAVIHRRVLPDFIPVIGKDLQALVNHVVEIRGILSTFRETPQIILNKTDQITLVDEASDSDEKTSQAP